MIQSTNTTSSNPYISFASYLQDVNITDQKLQSLVIEDLIQGKKESLIEYAKYRNIDTERCCNILLNCCKCYERSKTAVVASKILDLYPNSIEALGTQAFKYCEQTRFALATATYSRILELDSNNIAALCTRGECYRMQEEYDLAIEDFSRLLEIDSMHAQAWLGRGLCYRKQNKTLDAIDDLDKAAAFETNKILRLSIQAQICQLEGKLELAATKQQKAFDLSLADINGWLKCKLDDAYFLIRRGDSYTVLKKHDLAIEDYSRSLELEPQNIYTLTQRAKCHYKQNQCDAAIADLEEALQLAPDSGWLAQKREKYLGEK